MKANPRGADRRLRTRYRVRIPFIIKSDGQESRGITHNISLLGFSAYADTQLTQVQPVQCVLDVSNAKNPILANGTVVRCEPSEEANPDGSYEIGIFFKEFPGTSEADLVNYLERVSSEEQSAIQAGYRVLKQRLAARKRRKRTEELRKKKRRQERLRKRRLRLAKEKRQAERKQQKKAQAAKASSKKRRSTSAKPKKRSS